MDRPRALTQKPRKSSTKKARGAGEPALRRVPSQARSKERVERMLDAAEHEFAEHGYDAATTEAIAARAEASIGSLYQFFPNKRALFDAITHRYLGRVKAFFGELVARGAGTLSWPDLVDTIIDAFWTFARQSKAFRAVWIQGHYSPELLHASDAVNRAMAARADAVLATYAPHLTADERDAVATILIEVTGIVLFIASRKREPHASALIGETKRLMRAYVATYAESPRSPRPGPGAKNSSRR